jgi:CO dehydrogenase maturation factor
MKIAFVGKGGSGKSTMSWLFVNYLSSINKNVLAIDADHNMDLTSNLNADENEQIKTVQKSHKLFFNYFGFPDNAKWSEIKINKNNQPKFELFPHNEIMKQISTPISKNIYLMNAGLGEDDVIENGFCGHFLANPIRYFLSYVNDNNAEIIVDCVAGFDILNYGFQVGLDAFIGIIEPHKNSIKVMEQIKQNATASLVPLYIILNKPNNTEFTEEIRNKFKKELIGEINYDESLLNIDYNKVNTKTKESLSKIWEEINKRFDKKSQREIQLQLRTSFEE